MNLLIDDVNEWLEENPRMLEIIEEVTRITLKEEGFCENVEIGLILTDNKNIQQINLEYREINAPTDVLSFPQIDWASENLETSQYKNPIGGVILLGDIIISTERLEEQADQYGHSLERECGFLVAHSMLHLLGYDHINEEDKQEMFTKQETILQLLGLKR